MVRAAAGSSRYRERALYLSLLSARRVAESLGCPAAGLSLWPPGADQRLVSVTPCTTHCPRWNVITTVLPACMSFPVTVTLGPACAALP